jgi:hypothetical protein
MFSRLSPHSRKHPRERTRGSGLSCGRDCMFAQPLFELGPREPHQTTSESHVRHSTLRHQSVERSDPEIEDFCCLVVRE